MTDDRVELSALAPADDGRWEARVAATLLRVDAIVAGRATSEDILSLIARWQRPVLATAVVVIAALIPIEFALERREQRTESVRAMAQLASRSLEGAQLPSGAELRAAMSRLEVQ